MRIVFAGTPDFAATVLEHLLATGREPCRVYTQPDRPSGRGRRLLAGPVKRVALEHGVEVRQPARLGDTHEVASLAALAPDVMVVAAYGVLLPPSVLRIPVHGCINVHASILPRWRGAAPIQRAILAGDAQTGVSIMRMDAGLDTGPVYAERRCAITADDTAGTLHERLARLGCEALDEVLDGLRAGTAVAHPQDEALATYASRIDKSEARLAWDRAADELERSIRAFNPAPGAWTMLPGDGGRLRVLRARAEPATAGQNAVPGTVLQAEDEHLLVACAQGRLRLLEVQPAGRRPVSARQFLNARTLTPGDRLT